MHCVFFGWLKAVLEYPTIPFYIFAGRYLAPTGHEFEWLGQPRKWFAGTNPHLADVHQSPQTKFTPSCCPFGKGMGHTHLSSWELARPWKQLLICIPCS